ncbi:hypothetical protein EYF80_039183 [Liparis tanakae]|uniref:Uncharacterized protein n=1 Tax=Liparis tanakae TaxID=230148 RepID=A0A4Z2GB65_9TELE|nr:hypothetical protein EYF80_039183 [Liparis tanakae]
MAYLQQSVRSDLHHHGVLRHQAEALVEQHGAHQVVDVVVGRAVLSQRSVPLSLRDAVGSQHGLRVREGAVCVATGQLSHRVAHDAVGLQAQLTEQVDLSDLEGAKRHA